MEWLTVSNALSILVILLLVIDLIFRLKTHNEESARLALKPDSAVKEIFRDFRHQLSFTRVSVAVVILMIFIAIGVGWWWPHLQPYCTTAYDKLLDFAKIIFGIGKSPESISQVSSIFKGPQPPSVDPPKDEL